MAAAGRRVTLVAGAVGIFVAGCGVSLGAGERADRLPPSPAEVEAQVEPSMAAVATAFGRGSAFAIDGGYFVTTVDVVDPFDAVDLYLPGEPLLEDVPVAAVDLTADLAILGPVPGRRPPLLAAEDQDFARGDPLFLVGFPQEDGRPAIDAVPVRFDRYDATWGLGFVRLDGDLPRSMTGGAVVDRTGGLVAMASNTDLEGWNFALAETDLADAVDALLDGSAPAEATDWNPAPLVQGPTSHTVTIDGPSDIHAFTISGDAWAEEMVIEVSDPRARVMLMENGFYALSLNDPAKEAAQANEPWWSLGMEVETFADLAPEDPLRLHVRDDQRGQDRVVLVGAAEPIDDLRIETEPGSVEVDILPEIGSIEVGEEVVGATGFLDAFEVYAVDLEVGKPVVIDVETATGRPALLVVHAGRAWNETANEELRTSTEEGTGMLSRDVREVFEPFTSGRHLIIVTTYDETASSYRLRVSPA